MIRMLGDEARRLRFLVWMGDFANQYVSLNESWWGEKPESPAVQFYANDYLIFPSAPRQYQHDFPDVTNTFAPFFLRALQALQTETPANAARWIGSLLHFTTDTGSPPHAASISGDMHTKMENWIQGSAISISGYQPRLFGEEPTAAIRGFGHRMAGLVAFSKQRAERLRPLIITTNRAAAEPIIMQSANETARVTADLLHTLLFLAERTPEVPSGQKGFGNLEASISAPTLQGLESMPAKLMISGTAYSTLSELVSCEKGLYQGAFLLRNVRPGSYSAIVSRVGNRALFLSLKIELGKRAQFDWKLDGAEGNLVRNPDFQIHWVSKDPENWRFDKPAASWVSDNIKVRPGAKYRVEAAAQDAMQTTIQLRWYK
ncbi:MAG TPA: hypothetical protein VKM56_05570, partial [Verrucomicrobiae bacterium]|nr:hypothetical protein [Verrucomicrobiae bacterium]